MSVTKYHPALISAALFGTVLLSGTVPAAAQPAEANRVAPSRADALPGQPYELGTFEAWNVRCVRTEAEETDPCEMNQLLVTSDGNPTAEINVFPVGRDGIAAGATVVTPLETLLPRNLRLAVDGANGKVYPFQLCTRQGCVVQLGLTEPELDAMKAGSQAIVTIFPAAAPDTPVTLSVSLAGFTAAYAMLGLPGLQ